MKKLTKWEELKGWIEESQSALGLPDWEVNVIEDASDVDSWADIDAHSQAPTADLRVSHDFWRQTPEKQRLVLTHELLHLAFARYAQVTESLEEPLGKIAWAVISPQLENAEERTVEHLARVLAPYLSLPEFPKA